MREVFHMIWVGVDTDLNGGIAVIDMDGPRILTIREMPVIEGVEGRQVDAIVLFEIFRAARDRAFDVRCCVERAIVKPQKSAKGAHMTSGIGTMHQTYGAVRALAEINFTKVDFAWPSAWKRKMGLTTDKNLSLLKAAERHPAHAAVFQKAKRHGLAEAVLIAHWAHENCT